MAVALSGRGSAVLPGAAASVWEALLDPDVLCAAIPGAQAVERTGCDRFAATIAFGVGPVRGHYRAELALSDLLPLRSLDLAGHSGGAFGRGWAAARVALTALPHGRTRVAWSYRGEVSGPVAIVGRRLLQTASELFIRRFFARLRCQEAGGG